MFENKIEYPENNKQTDLNTKIYVLPALVERNLTALKILFLTDGNNRARGLNQGYDAGGKNVVEIARHLARRGDVSEMLACIMSEENALKRSDEFFEKLYQAFVALGIRIQTKGILTKDGIRMEVEGNLKSLAARSRAASDLAEMINTVCELTHDTPDPRMKLVLGVNYDKDIALDSGVDIIFRSGMEEPSTTRLSGLRSHRGINNIGSTSLWPDLTTNEVDREIDHSKHLFSVETPPLRLGHDMKTIMEIVEKTCQLVREGADVTMPYIGSTKRMEELLKDSLSNDNDTLWKVDLYDKQGFSVETEKAQIQGNSKVRLIPAAFRKLPEGDKMTFEAFIHPGKSGSSFLLPERPEIDYATVHHTDITPESICMGICRAVEFCQKHETLKGADRISTPRFVQITPETETHLDPQYLRLAETMIEKFLDWAPEINAPIDSPERLNSYINNTIISLFIAYDPAKPEVGNMDGNPLAMAEWLTKYMQLVYTGDEDVFDIVLPDETIAQRLLRLKASSSYLLQELDRKSDQIPDLIQEIPKLGTLQIIAKNWRLFQEYFAERSHPLLYQGWLEDIRSMYRCSINEYDPEITDNQLITRLASAQPEEQKQIVDELKSLYFGRIPEIVKTRIEFLTNTLFTTQNNRDGILRELRLWLYLSDIKTTIGAGLVLRTVALGLPKDQITEKQTIYLDNICSFFDYYVRLANDLSDSLKRASDDQDPKDDSCKILIREIQKSQDISPVKAKILAIGEVKSLFDWIEQRFTEELIAVNKVWPELGKMFDKPNYIKSLYKIGHFRTTDKEGMIRYLMQYGQK